MIGFTAWQICFLSRLQKADRQQKTVKLFKTVTQRMKTEHAGIWVNRKGEYRAMPLERFREEFHIEQQKTLNAVIGIFERDAKKSLVNRVLVELQNRLKEELKRGEYGKIRIAFVYESPVLEVRPFELLEQDSRIYYKEPGDGPAREYNLAYIWLMGIALLEQEQKRWQEEEQNGQNGQEQQENRFYLLLNDRLSRSELQLMFANDREEIRLHSRFREVDFFPVLIQSKSAECKILEEYVVHHGDCREAEEYVKHGKNGKVRGLDNDE